MSPRPTNVRDAGLRLISRLNRWMIAGSIGLAGVISLVAEQSFKGRTARAATTSSSQSSSSSSSGSGSTSSSSSGSGSIQQPSQAPAPAPAAPAPVISGGS